MKEADVFGCFEEHKIPFAMCIYAKDSDVPHPKENIAYHPLNIESKTLCRAPKQRDCIIESTSACTAASPLITAVTDLLIPLIRTTCPKN